MVREGKEAFISTRGTQRINVSHLVAFLKGLCSIYYSRKGSEALGRHLRTELGDHTNFRLYFAWGLVLHMKLPWQDGMGITIGTLVYSLFRLFYYWTNFLCLFFLAASISCNNLVY